jgi:serine protease AprX
LDFANSNIVSVTANRRALGATDSHGHGTHVAGIINGRSADGKYVGIAPDARVISVKVADDEGDADESDLLRGLQWVYDNRQTYNIRAVNLSISAAIPSSYLTSPIAAAAERLWRAGVVVVAAAGNQGSAKDAVWHAPGNDPFVITAGCVDDNATKGTSDDTQCTFSSRGTTQDGFAKPDVMAPGRKLYAPLASRQSTLGTTYPDRIAADGQHIRLSGTSGAAPVVTGLVALLLERYPALTPDQVKSALMTTGQGYKGQASKALLADGDKAFKLVKDGKQGVANQGLKPSVGLNPPSGSANETQTYWDQTYWDQTYWDQTYWDQTYWDQTYWDQGSDFD